MAHNIRENWAWIARDHPDGSTELVGVRYPNGDEVLREAMPAQQWAAYLRKAGLKLGKERTLPS